MLVYFLCSISLIILAVRSVSVCRSVSLACVCSQKKVVDEVKASEDVKPKQLKRRNADLMTSRVPKVEEKLKTHQNDTVKVSADGWIHLSLDSKSL